MDTAIIATFRFRHEGELARQILSDYGIQSVLIADDGGGMRPDLLTMRPIRLSVLATDAQRAREILGEHEWN
jgi:hypothetical protein